MWIKTIISLVTMLLGPLVVGFSTFGDLDAWWHTFLYIGSLPLFLLNDGAVQATVAVAVGSAGWVSLLALPHIIEGRRYVALNFIVGALYSWSSVVFALFLIGASRA